MSLHEQDSLWSSEGIPAPFFAGLMKVIQLLLAGLIWKKKNHPLLRVLLMPLNTVYFLLLSFSVSLQGL